MAIEISSKLFSRHTRLILTVLLSLWLLKLLLGSVNYVLFNTDSVRHTPKMENRINRLTFENSQDIQDGNHVLVSKAVSSDGLAWHYNYVLCGNIAGRLGNKMFMLAATIGVAYSLKHTPVIGEIHPLLKLFEMANVKRLQNVDQIQWKPIKKNWLSKDADEYKLYNLTMKGYFHSWEHFHNATEQVRQAFKIKPIYLNTAKSFLQHYINSNKTIVGIHVRRGDFLVPYKIMRGRTVANRTYILKAMEFYRQLHNDVQFVVCSNGMTWCKDNIKGRDVLYSEFEEPILDMAIMSLCHHMIITVGTFSWWGGWLSGGNVVYLNDFPRPDSAIAKALSTNSYYPPSWIGMSN